MEILKVKNYKAFAEKLKEKTECSVSIRLLTKNHIHYQLTKEGVPIGVLCINDGDASFAPFVGFDNVENNQFINVMYMPMLEDFMKVLDVFSEMFVAEVD